MLPLYLSIEGLYSYQDKQEIDFTLLTEAGLFGIFGKVGSGKSSILEAIGFCLYGETERLNKQEKRTYNMLNLKSDTACIVFEFLNFENRKCRFTAQWKRRKKFEDTTTLERLAYEWKENEWIPLESADGASVTNLTYPNFRRTIIIPQGQFKEFLELKGKERSDMMKEIFHLDRFDLGPKASFLQRQNNSRLDNLKGALSGFEAVSTDILESKQQELENARKQLFDIRKDVSDLEEVCKKLNDGRNNRAELSAKQMELQELHLEQPKIKQLESELTTYESTHAAFREILNQTQTLNKEKEQLTYKIEQLTVKKQHTLSQLEQKEQEWQTIATDYSQLERFRAEAEDLKLLIANRQLQGQKQVLCKRLEDGKPFLESEVKKEKELQDVITEKESQIEALKNNKVDTGALLAMESWYQTDDNLSLQLQEATTNISRLEQEITDIQHVFSEADLAVENWEQVLGAQENQLNQELHSLQNEITQLQVQVKLSEFADNLQEGEPCPLCGSVEHPHIMANHDLHEKERDINQRHVALKQALENSKQTFNQLNRSAGRLLDRNMQLQQEKALLATLQHKKDAHAQGFTWSEFSSTDKTAFLDYKNQSQITESHLRQAEQEIKNVRLLAQQAQAKAEKYKTTLADFQQQIAITESLIRQNEEHLRVLAAEEATQQEETELLNRKQQNEQKIKFLEERHKTLTEDIQQLKTAFAGINVERGIAKEQFQLLSQQLMQRQAEISALLTEHGFEDIIQVQQILQKNLNVASLRKTIQEFQVNLQVLLAKIEDLEKRIASDQFNEEDYQEKTQLLDLKKEELELQIRLTGALEKEFVRLQSEFEKKEKLLEEYEKLNLRKSNLTTLENLFRGAGFVNYVSSIHLQRLCKMANQRFHRLTKNNLSLTINENNEFEVIDYLNNGYKRSVKTLSGGQSFQASLCLALALAESIQALNKSDKNFFFIDEGFGTQDSDSINTVFETLQYLHKENRIVGIISHVDELKERIPRSITVSNDPEKGSQIRYNQF